ncbi:MAG TPA: hypothetical protein VKG43_14800, partial [Acidimicrobiales bacterium]|nr:hypothetical protein [Acidimicrobiales bacterium]
CPPGQNAPCPYVEVGPTANVGSDQWLFVQMYNFPTNQGQIFVDWCTNPGALTASNQATCVSSGSVAITNEPIRVNPFSDGSSRLSIQVAEVTAHDVPLNGSVLTGPCAMGCSGGFGASNTFICDGTSSNPCSIDIWDNASQVPVSTGPQANTAVIPVNFAPPGSGCPQAAILNSESEFGIERLLPLSAQLSCANDGTNASVALDTALDGVSAVNDVANGSVPVGFTDDPMAADQISTIKSANLALIPMVVSANTAAFRGVIDLGSQTLPAPKYSLTPTMVGGLVANQLLDNQSGDLAPCPGNLCSVPPCPNPHGHTHHHIHYCSLPAELNLTQATAGPPATYFNGVGSYAMFVRSDPSGTTHETFNWICSAPNPAVPVSLPVGGNVSITDPNLPAPTFTAALGNIGAFAPETNPKKWKCPAGTDQFPVNNVKDTNAWGAKETPGSQNKFLAAVVPPPGSGSQPYFGFALLNWAEASYYGLDPAALQNAAGAFVQPTATSIYAALGDATRDPTTGAFIPNFNNTSDPAAYPLPSVIYAVVKKGAVPAAEATQVNLALNQILDLTAGAHTSQLPGGFVPLSTSLYHEAQTDITADVPLPPAASTPGTATTSSGTPSAAATTTSPLTSTFTNPLGAHSTTPVALAKAAAAAKKAAAAAAAKRLKAAAEPAGFDLLASSSHMLLPVTLVLGTVALVLGALLVLSESARRSFALGLLAVGSGVRHGATWIGSQFQGLWARTRPPTGPGRPPS